MGGKEALTVVSIHVLHLTPVYLQLRPWNGYKCDFLYVCVQCMLNINVTLLACNMLLYGIFHRMFQLQIP